MASFHSKQTKITKTRNAFRSNPYTKRKKEENLQTVSFKKIGIPILEMYNFNTYLS